MVSKDERGSQPEIAREIAYPFAPRPQHHRNVGRGQIAEICAMIRRFDDDLVRAHPRHLIEDACPDLLERAFDAERRVFVGDNPHLPGRVLPKREELWRREILMPRTKGQNVEGGRSVLRKSLGRCSRSGAMMTQRPVSGSLRNSLMASLE